MAAFSDRSKSRESRMVVALKDEGVQVEAEADSIDGTD